MSRLPKRPALRLKNRGGAPKGNRNAWKTGAHSKPLRDLMAQMRDLRRRARQAIAKADEEVTQRGR